ncbi:MAG: nucleoside deaminase [Puniceicoccales bacterium]|jgi:tRNA(adenine34) deaminase|nr:nucleoside deaminase [Puniceicoccales bacterium]
MEPCPFEKKFLSVLRKDDLYFMSLAYNEAIDGWNENEIPIGAVIVFGNQVIASSHNSVCKLVDPTAHAEMLAITQAAKAIGDWRLNETRLYVTKEPCPMCSGAVIMSRIGEVIFGFGDGKMGCLGGAIDLRSIDKINHRPMVRGDVMATECYALIRDFLERKR